MKKKKVKKVVEKIQEKVSFDQFIWLMVQESAIKSYQKAELKVFFAKKGLTDKEELETYKKVFKSY